MKNSKSNFQFKFSIIMAIYNVENYLKEAIDSIIHQTLDFKKNIQMILVDDGSLDESKKIALEYLDKYPNNIVVLSQENSGQASARNFGLSYAKGKYINFLDSDDYLSKNTLKEVYDFFEKNDGEIDIVAIPMMLFERISGPHRLNYKFEENKVIDLVKEPNNPLLSASSSFIKYDSIKDYAFDTRLVNLEDALVINKILLEKNKYGVLTNCKYYYRQRLIKNSTVDGITTKKGYFTDRLKYFYKEIIDYCLDDSTKIPLFIQYLMAYDLQWLLRVQRLDIFDNENEINEFWYFLGYVLNHIDTDVVYDNDNILDSIKPFFLYLLGEKKSIDYIDGDLFFNVGNQVADQLSAHKIWLDLVEIKRNSLNISGTFLTNFCNKFISIKVIKNNSSEEFDCMPRVYNAPERKNQFRLGIPWQYCYNFDVSIPLTVNEEFYLKFIVTYDDGKFISSYESLVGSNYAVSLSDFSAYFSKKPYIVLLKGARIHIKKYNFISMLRYEYSNIKKIIKDTPDDWLYSIFIRVLYFALYPFMMNKHIWIFTDRPEFADDNAKHLFNYAVQKQDGIKKYFAVNEDTKSFCSMKKINKNIIAFGSLKHQILYLFSEKRISSYVNEDFINPFFVCNKQLYDGFITSDKIFLQHGVTKDDISRFIKKSNQNLSLIVTVSDLEKDSFLKEGYNYDESIIQVLGFPRYDNLNNNHEKKQILVMPTWRLQLKTEEEFLNSDYYNYLNNFLSNADLFSLLEDNGYSLVFKPHVELLKYVDLLNISNKVIVSKDESYQDLFGNSSLLITDYSSVFFDFAYLKKPVIYYQSTNDYHYTEGYFDYGTMGFGDVINDETYLIEKIKYYFDNHFEMEKKYNDNVDKFFKFNDKHNCKRVYDWILNH